MISSARTGPAASRSISSLSARGSPLFTVPRRTGATGVAGTRSRLSSVRVQALGFDFGDAAGAPPTPKPSVRVGAYQLRAASLLVFQSVLRGAVGEAFLATLAATQKYQAKNSEIVGAYAKLYQLLMAAGHDSWEDYLLDQILFGRENSLARAAAQGGADARSGAMEAVAFDLDMLQDMAISLRDIMDLVTDAAPTAGDYFAASAVNPGLRAARPSAGSKQLPSASAAAPAAVPLLLPGDGGAGGDGGASPVIAAPPTKEELAQWKAALAGHERWAAAAPLLLSYYRRHGFGITSRNSTLRWSKGAFEEAPEGAEGAPKPPLSANAALRRELDANTLRHAAGLPAQHALVCGPPGSGKSWMLWEGTLAAAKQKGIRLVEVTASELGNILDIARGCARYPRVRFILVADHVELPLRGSLLQDLSSGLSGAGGNGWPSNTLLYLGASSSSVVSASDPIVARAGLRIVTEQLDEAGFGAALGELISAYQTGNLSATGAELAAANGGTASAAQGPSEAAAGAKISEAEVKDAAAWCKGRLGELSLRGAALYARMLAGANGPDA